MGSCIARRCIDITINMAILNGGGRRRITYNTTRILFARNITISEYHILNHSFLSISKETLIATVRRVDN